jgi:tRNA(adenine34) deaminase
MDLLDYNNLFMNKAIIEAQKAYDLDEVPIGAVVVCNNQIIGKGHNQTETLNDVTAHAEMLAITSASNHLNAKYLDDCTLYVTVEPCIMCMGAIKHSRISKVVFGTFEPKTGYSKHINSENFTNKMEIIGGYLESECRNLMQTFFQSKRI